jgi:hypothetical protein
MDKSSMKATLLSTKGNGSEANPYQIANKYDLIGLRDRLIDGRITYAKLTADIDMQGEGWWPMNTTFYANSYNEGYGKAISLDGTGHIIKNLNIAAHKDNEFETGFFGVLAGTVKNLGLFNATVDGGNALSTGIFAGGLGTSENQAVVESCYVHGKLVGGNPDGYAGALAGSAGETTVQNVYVNAAVNSGSAFVGEFIGTGNGTLTVINSYSAGKYNDSKATTAFGDQNGTSTQNFLFYGIQNQAEICDIASKWEGWNEDGTIGNGWPLLEWQVQRGDHTALCGFGVEGDATGDGKVDLSDYQYVLNLMATEEYDPFADVTGDGQIDLSDYQYILNIMSTQ